MYLNYDSGGCRLEGSCTYKFPHDNSFTHMPVMGKLVDKNKMQLNLSQPGRFFWDEDEVRVRPAANYSFELVRDDRDSRTFTGVLYYPHPEVNSKIRVAEISFIEKD